VCYDHSKLNFRFLTPAPGVIVTESLSVSEQDRKTALKASLCVAAPALIPLVMLVSINSPALLDLTGLGRLGIAASSVLFLCLANLFWRGRWWAALPSLLAFAGGALYFISKFVRPFLAYVKVNPVNDITDLGTPFMMLSPSLVGVVICVSLGLVTWRGIRTVHGMAPRRLGRLVLGIMALWGLALAGDIIYQQGAWRYFNHPSALMERMCQGTPALRREVTERLVKAGPEAVDDLLLGLNSKDPDLDCLREQSRMVLLRMGGAAGEPLLKAALAGDQKALGLLGEIGYVKAVEPLLKRYREGGKEVTPAYRARLKAAIEKLDPTVKLK